MPYKISKRKIEHPRLILNVSNSQLSTV